MAGSARVFGITGSPGAGKSTLTSEITRLLVDRGYSVGIIAVDPSSPFSGGALLGDRLRMKALFTLESVYIRSMATRGMLGGLCQAARDVVRIMDAFGKDIVLIETVGVGQDEIEIVRTADRVMVVMIPGQGDGIQAIKAGVMEIADIYVVNKADKPGADEVAADIGAMLSLSEWQHDELPPVLQVIGPFQTGHRGPGGCSSGGSGRRQPAAAQQRDPDQRGNAVPGGTGSVSADAKGTGAGWLAWSGR